MIDLPPATQKPCNDCPWRRNAAPGWLGPYTADEWVKLAHSEQPIACHQTIPEGTDGRSSEEIWKETPGLRQCKGAAIYRNNVFKSQRNPTDAENTTEPDLGAVFGFHEFEAYHTRRPR